MIKRDRYVAVLNFRRTDGHWSSGIRMFERSQVMMAGMIGHYVKEKKANGKKEFQGRVLKNGVHIYSLNNKGTVLIPTASNPMGEEIGVMK